MLRLHPLQSESLKNFLAVCLYLHVESDHTVQIIELPQAKQTGNYRQPIYGYDNKYK